MMGHSYSTAIAAPIENATSFIQVLEHPLFPIVGTATFAVDTFFFLSGFLTFYLLTLKLYPTKGKTNLLLLYLHRYLRLLPILFFVYLFGRYLFAYIDNGTNYDWVRNIIVSNCKTYWWTNFLYINNIVPWDMNSQCIGWAWYLANDMQFFLLSPLLISLYCKNRKLGYLLLTSLILLSCLIGFSLSLAYEFPPAI